MARTSERANGNGRHGASNQLFDDAIMLAGSLLRNRISYGSDKIKYFADATRKYSESMSDLPNVREYASMAADQLESVSGYVSETDIRDIMHDASALARRRPLATLGIAVVAGYVLTRLVAPQSMNTFSSSRPVKRSASRKPAAKKTVRKAASKTAQRKRANG